MAKRSLPDDLRGRRIHLVGAKGTGMTALAEILAGKGALLSGSDVADIFYTDAILSAIGVRMGIGFEASRLPPDCDLVIHSAAYAPDKNPELVEAARRGIPIMNYPEALGALSRRFQSAGIAGVHGKTTTTALAGSIAAALRLPATIVAGSAVAGFGGRSTKVVGDSFLIAETCEYRRHFLNFSPSTIVLTSIEADHQDYYPTYEDIFRAFVEYIGLLPEGGRLVYCADDEGARAAALEAARSRPDLRLLPYGGKAEGPYRLHDYRSGQGRTRFKLAGFGGEFELRVPGEHIALDATAALALCVSLAGVPEGEGLSLADPRLEEAKAAMLAFAGSKRRSEIVGEESGVLILDDYGHHPTAIAKTIEGIRDFWPGRRIVVDFMSHTYTRTKALFADFASALDSADEVVIHRIYASAREVVDPTVSGALLAEAIKARASVARHSGRVRYFEEPHEALPALLDSLGPGDLFLTMGAGDNWKLGVEVLASLAKKKDQL